MVQEETCYTRRVTRCSTSILGIRRVQLLGRVQIPVELNLEAARVLVKELGATVVEDADVLAAPVEARFFPGNGADGLGSADCPISEEDTVAAIVYFPGLIAVSIMRSIHGMKDEESW